jgi:hypothetical protein
MAAIFMLFGATHLVPDVRYILIVVKDEPLDNMIGPVPTNGPTCPDNKIENKSSTIEFAIRKNAVIAVL